LAEAEAKAIAGLLELQESLAVSNRLVQSLKNATLPQISFTVSLLDTMLGGQHVSLHFRFPRKYPELEALSVRVDCSGDVGRRKHQQISCALQMHAEQLVGQESVLEILQRVRDLVTESSDASTPDHHDNSNISEPSRLIIVRRVLWFHHLKAMSKRKAICDWGKELQLGGYCKPGFPGVLIFEGHEDNVLEYQQRLQRLRWQALQMRGEEKDEGKEADDIDTLRRFPVGIQELCEGSMSELASYCRAAKLESLFLTALKIDR
jgi:hypothetical protein